MTPIIVRQLSPMRQDIPMPTLSAAETLCEALNMTLGAAAVVAQKINGTWKLVPRG